MAATVLTKEHYDGVRGLIAPDVTAEHISDKYLDQQPFAPEAERTVRKLLKTAGVDVDSLTGDTLDAARLAMMHECAATLCLTAPQQIRESALQVQTEVQTVEWQKKQQFHLAKVDERVNAIIANVAPATPPPPKARRNPFGAVGTQRSEIGTPAYPYRRVPDYD